MKRVVFFNHWKNGDIHLARGIVRRVMSKVKSIDSDTEFVYSHNNSPTLLKDIDGLRHDPSLLNEVHSQESFKIIGDTAYINTWYDQQQQKYARLYGIITLDAIYGAIDESCQKIWNFSLSQISENAADFFPTIDYSKYDIGQASRWLSNHPESKILVENGDALSNQSRNFDIMPAIITLANNNPNQTFILSKKDGRVTPANIVYTSNIIGKANDSDLNEISFLSAHCSMIVGKASGVFTYTVTKENLFDRNIKYVCFSHLMVHQPKFWLGRIFAHKTQYSSSITVSGAADVNQVYDLLKNYF